MLIEDQFTGELYKNCGKCEKELPISKFYKQSTMADGYRTWCKECTKEGRRVYYKNNGNEHNLRLRYGITKQEHTAMSEKQNNLCAICKEPEIRLTSEGKIAILSVDHCHDTGRVRGLLCIRCNTAIGMFRNSPEFLQAAITYLKKHE